MIIPLTAWCSALLVLTAAWTAASLQCFSHRYLDGRCSGEDAVGNDFPSAEACCQHPEAYAYAVDNRTSFWRRDGTLCELCHERVTNSSVDGEWSEWTSYSPCSTTCGKGQRKRHRQCNSPAPRGGGKPCDVSPLGAVSIVRCESPACSPAVPQNRTDIPGSSDSLEDSPKTFPTFSYYVIGGVAGALLLIGVLILVLRRTNACCFQKNDLRLEALEAASAANSTERQQMANRVFFSSSDSQSYKSTEAVRYDEIRRPPIPVRSYDNDGYEIPRSLPKPPSPIDQDIDHTYEDMSVYK